VNSVRRSGNMNVRPASIAATTQYGDRRRGVFDVGDVAIEKLGSRRRGGCRSPAQLVEWNPGRDRTYNNRCEQ
jgi:hypothetical protein